MRQVVLGAGPVGVALGDLLRAEGGEAEVVSIIGNPDYDMPGTTPPAVDGTDVAELRRVCEGADVIYLLLNAHYVDWYELFPPRLEAAIEVARSVGAMLVYHDNVYPYGPTTGELTETTPCRATTRKGQLRARMARSVLDAVKAGGLLAVIGRSADLYGPGALNSSFNSTLGARHFPPLLSGRPVSVVGDIDAPHTYAYVDDVVRGLLTIGRADGVSGEVFHLPAAPTLSHRELLTIAFELAGHRPRIRGSKISGYVVRVVGRFQADVGEVAELLYQFERPLVVSHRKFEQAFGATPTPHRDALAATLDWYRAN